MRDTSDRRRRLARETGDQREKTTDAARERRPEQREAERVRQRFNDHPSRGSRPEDQLRRQERIEQRSSMRHLPDFDARRELRRENAEIRENPEAFLRRHEGEGLDAATEREVWQALRCRERRHPRPDDLREV